MGHPAECSVERLAERLGEHPEECPVWCKSRSSLGCWAGSVVAPSARRPWQHIAIWVGGCIVISSSEQAAGVVYIHIKVRLG